MRLQILVTTMHQTDLALVEKMNIKSDVLFVNQADGYDYRKDEDGFSKEMVTTSTRGLSINRNIAISCSSPTADYIMFLDDDATLCDGYLDIIKAEFDKHPRAEAIKFMVSATAGERHRQTKEIKFCKANRKRPCPLGARALKIGFIGCSAAISRRRGTCLRCRSGPASRVRRLPWRGRSSRLRCPLPCGV